MTVRCAAQACVAIDETHRIIAADHAGELFLTSPVGDRPVTRLTPRITPPATSAAAYASTDTGTGTGDGARAELLTIAPDGQAFLSRHSLAHPARVVTLFGTCISF